MAKKPMKVADIHGWFLVAWDDDAGWNIAWLDPFRTKKRALEFAKRHNWPCRYLAMRGRLTVAK